jgi:phage-related tail fiber protein
MVAPPTGWLICDGSLISRTVYIDLFSAIGTTFGSGDGATTFALPDLRGEFIRGWDDDRSIDSDREFGSWQKASAIAGDVAQGASVASIDNTLAATPVGLGWDDISDQSSDYSAVTVSGYGPKSFSQTEWANTQKYVGGARPRNVALLACIKI